MLGAICRFLRGERGLEMVEWAIVGGIIVAVGASIFTLIAGDASSLLGDLENVTQQAAVSGN